MRVKNLFGRSLAAALLALGAADASADAPPPTVVALALDPAADASLRNMRLLNATLNARDHQRELKALQKFEFVDAEGKDNGVNANAANIGNNANASSWQECRTVCEGHNGCCTSTDTTDAETPSFDATFSVYAVLLKSASPHAAVTAYLA